MITEYSFYNASRENERKKKKKLPRFLAPERTTSVVVLSSYTEGQFSEYDQYFTTNGGGPFSSVFRPGSGALFSLSKSGRKNVLAATNLNTQTLLNNVFPDTSVSV